MLTSFSMHPEDIKAAIRKSYGSLAKFERAKGLKSRSVTDVLMGRVARPTAEVVAAEVGHTAESLFPGVYKSASADSSDGEPAAHRLNSQAA